jgi:phosphatidylglycerophosphate synthase
LRWIPNALTTLRLALLVPFAYCLVTGRYRTAGIVYVIALLTDLDGAIARRYGWTSRFGAVYDPTVDGLYLVAGSVLLVGAGLLPLLPLAAYLVSVLFRLVPSLVHLRVTRGVQSTRLSKATAFCGYGAVLLATFGSPESVTGTFLVVGAVLNTTLTVSWIRKGRFVLKQ